MKHNKTGMDAGNKTKKKTGTGQKAVEKMNKIRKITMMIVAMAVGFGLSAKAQARQMNEVEAPIPWVSHISGDDSSLLGRQADTDWFEAPVNTPFGEGDAVWQGNGGRSEIFFQRGTYVRLDANSGIEFLQISHNGNAMLLTRGTMEASNNADADMYVDVPGQTVMVTPGAKARISAVGNGTVETAVKKGSVYVDGPSGLTRVRAGQTLIADENGNIVRLSRGVQGTSFDNWTRDRDRMISASVAPPTTAVTYLPEPAAAQLSAHGTWRNDPEYGWVWAPRVSVGWAPYRVGKWTHRSGWGWTWISYEPWGYYPYHYGRWVVSSGNWVWVPVQIHRTWSPALVFWIDGPDYYAWHPIPVGVSLSVVFSLGPDVIVNRYCHSNYITVVHHNHFRGGHYERHAVPWRNHSNTRYTVIRDHNGPKVRYGDRDVYRTPTTRGYIPREKAPRRDTLYVRNIDRNDPRKGYGNRNGNPPSHARNDRVDNRKDPRGNAHGHVGDTPRGNANGNRGNIPPRGVDKVRNTNPRNDNNRGSSGHVKENPRGNAPRGGDKADGRAPAANRNIPPGHDRTPSVDRNAPRGNSKDGNSRTPSVDRNVPRGNNNAPSVNRRPDVTKPRGNSGKVNTRPSRPDPKPAVKSRPTPVRSAPKVKANSSSSRSSGRSHSTPSVSSSRGGSHSSSKASSSRSSSRGGSNDNRSSNSRRR